MWKFGGSRVLEAVIHRGARAHQTLLRETIGAVTTVTLLASAAGAFTYLLVMFSAGRADWKNMLLGAAGAMIIPIFAVALLIITARRGLPFTMSLLTTAVATSFVVSFLSALRLPVSYVAFAALFPLNVFLVALANISINRKLAKSVALLDFEGVSSVAKQIGWDIPILPIGDLESSFRRVLIDPIAHHSPAWSAELTRLYIRGVQIEAWPSYLERITGRVDLNYFELSDVSYSPSQILYYRAKRVLDIIGVLILAVPALLLVGLAALYVRIIDGGPSFFVQKRRGYGGAIFNLHKIRTMYRGDHTGSTAVSDVRIMPGCSILRQMRIDELPQLYNIFKGDMSFIGPRPVSLEVAEALEARIPLYVTRNALMPGLTGWAQVTMGYAQSEFEEVEKLAFDLYYLKHVSLDLDMIILFRTIRTILLRIGSR